MRCWWSPHPRVITVTWRIPRGTKLFSSLFYAARPYSWWVRTARSPQGCTTRLSRPVNRGCKGLTLCWLTWHISVNMVKRQETMNLIWKDMNGQNDHWGSLPDLLGVTDRKRSHFRLTEKGCKLNSIKLYLNWIFEKNWNENEISSSVIWVVVTVLTQSV